MTEPLTSADALAAANAGARRAFCVKCERGHDGECTGPVPTRRSAVAPVANVHLVLAENGATVVAPPPEARRVVGARRARTAEDAARALAAYVRAVELGQDINSHYEAAVAAAHAWTEATS